MVDPIKNSFVKALESIKNEQVRKMIADNLRGFWSPDVRTRAVLPMAAIQAVKLAEADARERAVKAYCKSVYGVFCDDCDSCDFYTDTCERRNEYLKYYDNE